MIVFLYGSDSYRLRQERENLIGRYKTKHPSGMNLFSVDLSESANITTLENALQSSSFFNEHKLIVCKNSFIKKPGSELLGKYIKEHDLDKATDITLIVTENMSAKELSIKNKELFKTLTSVKNLTQEIEPLEGNKLLEWVRKEFEARDCSIELGTAKNLVNLVGTDSWSIINEIEKLTGYKTGEITTADITNLVTSKINLSIFDLIDSLGTKDRRRGLELLYKELRTGRDPYYILTMIIYQFRNLLIVKDLQNRSYSESEIIKKSKLNPFVVKKIIKSHVNLLEASKTYRTLLAFDTGFKTGELDIENSLYNIVLS